MADTERMEAVKRAYAEIILNTAAESAARILAAERKALALQRSLASAKQDALHMMLRLKSLTDAKITEAETRNLLHAQRIHQLQSQLDQAHSLILSLQSDLHRERQAQAQANTNKLQEQKQQQQENTSSYYKNLLSTDDDSACSVKDNHLLSSPTPTPIPGLHTHHASKVRPRNRWTQRVRAFHQSKHPKGGQILAKKVKNKKSRENASVREVFFSKDPPRRSRTKSNYVKISKFGMKVDADVSQNANKVLRKCTEKETETMHNLDSGKGLATDQALVGLELIADNIDKGDDTPAVEEPRVVLTGVNPKPTETKPVSLELEIPVPDVTPERTSTSVIEPSEGLRSIKYTFRRKRKRALSENNNEGAPTVIPVLEDNKDGGNEGNNMCNDDDNRKNEEIKEGNGSEVAEDRAQRLKLHQNDEGVASDSPRTNRRLVQVARQLISLSTKKW